MNSKNRKMKVTEINKAAFMFFICYDRERWDIEPPSAAEKEKIWKRAQKHAPASTDSTVCLALSPSDIEVLNREGYKTKTRYVPF